MTTRRGSVETSCSRRWLRAEARERLLILRLARRTVGEQLREADGSLRSRFRERGRAGRRAMRSDRVASAISRADRERSASRDPIEKRDERVRGGRGAAEQTSKRMMQSPHAIAAARSPSIDLSSDFGDGSDGNAEDVSRDDDHHICWVRDTYASASG